MKSQSSPLLIRKICFSFFFLFFCCIKPYWCSQIFTSALRLASTTLSHNFIVIQFKPLNMFLTTLSDFLLKKRFCFLSWNLKYHKIWDFCSKITKFLPIIANEKWRLLSLIKIVKSQISQYRFFFFGEFLENIWLWILNFQENHNLYHNNLFFVEKKKQTKKTFYQSL